MSNFIDVTILERMDGTPGLVAEEEFNIHMNLDNITLYNKSPEMPGVTFVRLTCGASLCVLLEFKEFIKILKESGAKIYKSNTPKTHKSNTSKTRKRKKVTK